jgi:23S rRNA (guanosine2251-2'-O)-methyltransferase
VSETVLEGLISVASALKARSRDVHVVYILRDLREPNVLMLARLAAEAGVTAERVSSGVIEAYAEGKTHGGIIALVGERRFVDLDVLIEGKECPFVVMLDGVEDPYNFGQAVRAFYAAGADGLVLRPRNWMSASGLVARSSAGTSELLLTAVAETPQAAADFYRSRGLVVAVTDKDRARSIYEADLTPALFLVIGGEKRGVTRSFVDEADMRLKIPYGREFRQSLGTTAAAAVLAFEVMRQRMIQTKTTD